MGVLDVWVTGKSACGSSPVASLNMVAFFSNASMCLLGPLMRFFSRRWSAWSRRRAVLTALSIGVSLGTLQWVG